MENAHPEPVATDFITIHRTDASDAGFRALVQELDADLAVRNGVEQDFYGQFNGLDAIRHVVVAQQDGKTLGCGAIKEFEPGVMEVKRMFVPPYARRRGIAAKVLSELEAWARELGYRSTILETGRRHEEAISLYLNAGYTIIPNYGQYAGIEGSVCFQKQL
jgi:putative acetyltransferase